MASLRVYSWGFIFLVAILIPATAGAQARDEIWEMREDVTLDRLLSDWDPSTDTCGAALADAKLGGYASVVIYKIVPQKPGDPGPYHVVVLQTNNADGAMTGYAAIKRTYCIKETALRDNFRRREPFLSGGVLSVPFKLRFGPTKVMAGGSLGGYVGHNFRHSAEIASTPLAFASLTAIPLNDMNEAAPETKWGVSVGVGYVVTIPSNFQFGVVVGWDIFSRPDDWPWGKFEPWLAFSVGYSFTSPQKQNSGAAVAAAVQ